MSRQKKAAFLADCLAHMPKQRPEVKAVVDTVILGLKRIAAGGEWPEDEADAAADAADWAAAMAADWAAASAAYWAVANLAWAVDRAADYAARTHPDPDKERARQAKVREELGL
jgi:hypothetical protein